MIDVVIAVYALATTDWDLLCLAVARYNNARVSGLPSLYTAFRAFARSRPI